MKGENMHDPIPLPVSEVAPGRVENPPPASINPLPQPLVTPELRGGGSQPEAGPLRFPQSPGESDRAVEAFRAYLELGPQRRHHAVARKVGASLRTVKRWASDFDWKGRIKSSAAQGAERFAATESAVRREEFLDAAARAKAFRDRQFALAETLLAAAERFLVRMDGDDLDQMNFAGACKALEVAARLGQSAVTPVVDDASTPARSLRDQLAVLLDQAYAETPAPTAGGGRNQSSATATVQP